MKTAPLKLSNQRGFNTALVVMGVLFVAVFALIGVKAYQVISARPSIPAPTVNISATPISVAYGTKSQLVWTTSNATTCTATGGWSGTQPTQGKSSTGSVIASTAYGLTCSGPGGNSSGITSVNISASSTQ